jgi:predicted ArsR family transcriptional regulator
MNEPTGTWVFLTNHAHVLLSVARDPEIRARDIAEQVGITERAAQRILADLVQNGYVAKTKTGRRNRYSVNPQGRLRSPLFRDFEIGPLLEILNTGIQDGGVAGH